MMRLMTVCAAFAAGVVLPLAAKPLDTAAVFASPTQEYGVNCWWWWLNGNTDKATLGNGRIRLTWTWQIRPGLIISFH